MILSHGIDKKVAICDIETLLELFHVGIYDPDSKEWTEFEVSAYNNQLFAFVKHYTSKNYDYLVTFNGINFDQQVLEWVVDNHQKWIDQSNLEICKLISDFAGRTIENSNYGMFPSYRDDKFSITPIDLFRIHHLDNEAKFGRGGGMVSLKWCEFMMNMDVEEMPIHHLKKGLTQQEIRDLQAYCRHDIMATYKLLQLTIGEDIGVPELADYAGKNKIQDRIDIMKETGLPCLNWSDVKIGEEWNKMEYMKVEGILDEKKLFPDKVKHPFGKKFKVFFPPSLSFKTKKLQDFAKKVGETFIINDTQEFPITIGETTYTIAKGGIHSTEKHRKLRIPEGWSAKDADVGAQYPRAIIKLRVYPPHLKESILINFISTEGMKDTYKQLGKEAIAKGNKLEAARLKGLEGGTKLRMNGGYYGKLNQPGSFLQYPEGTLKVTIGCQFEILMLIEAMEEAGFKVISGNTDGIVTLYPKDREQEYLQICKEWEIKVGNDIKGKLEFTEFVGLWQESVNSYIAKSADGKVKKKGRFATIYGSPGCEINKNKSKRIIPLALEAYFIHGKDPIQFIENHNNIFDFCIAKKATGQMHYEEQWIEDGNIVTKTHKKLVRYFISKKGTVLWKRGINNKGKSMNNHCEAETDLGQPLVTYFN